MRPTISPLSDHPSRDLIAPFSSARRSNALNSLISPAHRAAFCEMGQSKGRLVSQMPDAERIDRHIRSYRQLDLAGKVVLVREELNASNMSSGRGLANNPRVVQCARRLLALAKTKPKALVVIAHRGDRSAVQSSSEAVVDDQYTSGFFLPALNEALLKIGGPSVTYINCDPADFTGAELDSILAMRWARGDTHVPILVLRNVRADDAECSSDARVLRERTLRIAEAAGPDGAFLIDAAAGVLQWSHASGGALAKEFGRRGLAAAGPGLLEALDGYCTVMGCNSAERTFFISGRKLNPKAFVLAEVMCAHPAAKFVINGPLAQAIYFAQDLELGSLAALRARCPEIESILEALRKAIGVVRQGRGSIHLPGDFLIGKSSEIGGSKLGHSRDISLQEVTLAHGGFTGEFPDDWEIVGSSSRAFESQLIELDKAQRLFVVGLPVLDTVLGLNSLTLTLADRIWNKVRNGAPVLVCGESLGFYVRQIHEEFQYSTPTAPHELHYMTGDGAALALASVHTWQRLMENPEALPALAALKVI